MKLSLLISILSASIICYSSSCKKESFPYLSASIKGQVLDRITEDPIPFADVYLLELNTDDHPGGASIFEFWDTIEHKVSDSQGNYQFSYEGREVYRYAIYSKKDRYLDEKRPWRINIHDTLKNVNILPLSFLKMNLIDEPPYRSFDSLWFLTTVSQKIPTIFSPFTDTVIIAPHSPNESLIITWVFWENGEDDRINGSANCNALDTCEFEIIY